MTQKILLRDRRLARRTAAAWVTLLLVGCATTAPTKPPAQPQQQQELRYRCDGGAELEVTYLNPPSGESYASLLYQGRMAVLQSRPSGSGVRYVDQDEQQGLRWHTKGQEGMLSVMPADHTAREQVLLSGCRVIQTP